jgi:hypothetical protein
MRGMFLLRNNYQAVSTFEKHEELTHTHTSARRSVSYILNQRGSVK